MELKLYKKQSILFILCILFLCAFIPTTTVKASTVKKTGYYYTQDLKKGSASYPYYLKKVKLSKKSLTTYGSFGYFKSLNAFYNRNGSEKKYKAQKRSFIITKKTKCYIGYTKDKKISIKTAYKYMKKMNLGCDIMIRVKNKKVTTIYIQDLLNDN